MAWPMASVLAYEAREYINLPFKLTERWSCKKVGERLKLPV